MGMCSSFDYEDIEVKHWDEFLAYYKKHKEDNEYWEHLIVDEKNKTISFEGYDGWKIISYWYAEFCAFLRDIAVFIEGEVIWTFENQDEGGYVTFKNGKATIHAGNMAWNDYTPEEIGNSLQKMKPMMKPMSKELKDIKLLMRL